MVTSNMNNIIKIAVNYKKNSYLPFGVEKLKAKSETTCKQKNSDSENKSEKKRTYSSNVFRNINSAIFTMLLQRTSFTLIALVLMLNPICFVSADIINPDINANVAYVRPVDEKVPQKESVLVKPEVIQPEPVYIPLNEFSTVNLSSEATFQEIHQKPTNRSIKTGYVLWDMFLNECTANPSLSCIQKNVYTYLNDNLKFNGDVNVTDGWRFKKNRLPFYKYSEKANLKKSFDEEDVSQNEVENDDVEEARYSESPIEEISGALYDKSIGFAMSHDMELQLPEMMFNGAVLKVSPRAFEGTGVLLHMDLAPRSEVENTNGEGRIFFKKFKKYIKNKILLAIIAIVLIVKLVKLKLFIILPLLLGVHNAKKLFLKLVLFVFPALGQIFKLCSWYHDNYHHTKFHQHHHHISHIHHPPSFGGHHSHGGYPSSHGPPSSPGHVGSVEVHGGYPPAQYQHEPSSWEFSGPGLGPEYLSADIHRNSVAFNPKVEDANVINSWGLGTQSPNTAYTKAYSAYDDNRYVRATANNVDIRAKPTAPQGPPYQKHPNDIIYEKEAMLKAVQRQQELKLAQQLLRQQEGQKAAIQQQLNQVSKTGIGSQEVNPVYDPFYTPILQRIDQIFAGLGVQDEPCRERLVCSMYKNPSMYSPHSNLLSNELSRDADELQKPPPGSTAAIRFFKYVQAARDGQDKSDCLQIYQNCAINTES